MELHEVALSWKDEVIPYMYKPLDKSRMSFKYTTFAYYKTSVHVLALNGLMVGPVGPVGNVSPP